MYNKNMTVKLKKDLDVTTLGNEKVMIDFSTGKYFLLKGTGNDIWEYLKTTPTIGQIVDNLLENYEVSEEECFKAVISFLEQMKKYDFVSFEE